MNAEQLKELLHETPIIAAIKSDEGLEKCLVCDAQVIFILYGNILGITEQVRRLKQAGKLVFVHIDLIEGLSSREIAVDYIAQNTEADGIISTKQPLIRYAKAKGLLAIQRFFLLDSMALENLLKQATQDASDMIEILPGVMPKIVRKLVARCKKPIIAGGLISDKEDVMCALGAGATAISSTDSSIWFL